MGLTPALRSFSGSPGKLVRPILQKLDGSVTNAGALKNQWRAESATTDDDELAGFKDPALLLTFVKRLCRYSLDACCAISFNDDLINLSVANKVQVLRR